MSSVETQAWLILFRAVSSPEGPLPAHADPSGGFVGANEWFTDLRAFTDCQWCPLGGGDRGQQDLDPAQATCEVSGGVGQPSPARPSCL